MLEFVAYLRVTKKTEPIADHVTSEKRSEIMRTVKTKNTKPELIVRSMLHRLGYRFRLHRKDLPGTPDIVFPGRRIAMFVNGCYWHGHGCRWGQPPKSRLEYWLPKIEANKARDRRKSDALEAEGWRVETVWQCELKDLETLSDRLVHILEGNESVARIR